MARCECREKHAGANPVDHGVGGCPNDAHREKLCGPCAAHAADTEAARLHSNPVPHVPISPTGSTVEDLQNDLAALDCARLAVRYALDRYRDDAEARAVFSNGAGAYEADAVVAWLREKIAETENTIDALDGSGPPLPPAVTVGVEIEGGLVQAVFSDVPARVIVIDKDTEGSDYPRTIEIGGGRAFVNDWETTGDDEERESIRTAKEFADEANERQRKHNVDVASEDVPRVPACSDEEARRG